ncbi:pilin [Pseudomonas resinovorans]|uniref:Pilin n=2 Tax=Metapseudomonas resinovorans TaxID=53412 RepID=A0ABT4XZS0_METRE|nr:pilin [Pseudomonas resinovorans]MDA8482036.1 pilin [Pseudomonas resinovorans]
MSEIVLAASSCRTVITEVYQTATASAAPAANGWGCESASGTSKYVSAIATTANGKVLVTIASGIDASLTGDEVILEPRNAAGTALTSASMPVQVSQWACGSDSADARKYLPGSCKETLTAN